MFSKKTILVLLLAVVAFALAIWLMDWSCALTWFLALLGVVSLVDFVWLAHQEGKQKPVVEEPKAQTWFTACQCGYNVYYNPMKINLNSGKTNVEVDLSEKRIVVLRCNACFKTGDYVFPDKFKNLNP